MNQFEENTLFANRYQLIEKLGIGGYSEVWKAEDSFANKMPVAIKIFAPDKGLNKSGLELFGKEYTLVFNLNHPNLLKPMHYDVYKDSPYLVLQYCSKGSLYQKIGKLTETEIAAFIQQSASALAYLHQQETPIIHQDIKPDNFLIDNNGNYLLADFGISSKIRRTLTRSIGEKASTGTMAYMPPEKFSRERQTIKAGDIFSLGVCIYELLTGDLPFGEHGGVAMLSGAEIPDLPKGFSPQLNDLLSTCLAKEPWDRPTAETLMEFKIEEPEKKQIRETVQMPVNVIDYDYDFDYNKDFDINKEQPSTKPPFDSYGKPLLYIGIAIALFFTIIYFALNNRQTTEEKLAAEQAINNNYTVSDQQIPENKNMQSKFGSFTDPRDGKTYKTIKIGNQIWMAENLAFTGNNGYQRQITDADEWENNMDYDGWCYYDNDASNCRKYGVLYQWEAAKKACPKGWHLPTDKEWKILTDYLGGENIAGGKLKEAGFTHWKSPNEAATNEIGFTALPGGIRSYYGTYYDIGFSGGWCSSTESSTSYAWFRYMCYDNSDAGRLNFNKTHGFSVRCIKD